MITTFYPPYHFGGDGVYVQALSNELTWRGHDVTVIHDKDAYRFLAQQEPSPDKNTHPNVKVHGLASRAGWLSSLATQQTGMPLVHQKEIQTILAQGFDVIHYHNISLVGGPRILSYGDALKLYTLHEFWLVCPMHVLFRNNQAICDKPACLRCSLHYGRPPQLWRYTNLLPEMVRYVDMFLAPSCFSMSEHRARGLRAPMTHLPNFVAPLAGASVFPDDLAQYADTPYFLYVGRLEKLKGVQTIIPAFRNRTDARLLIAGQGNYEPELRGLARDDPNIVFVGRRNRADVQALMRNAIALIVPSLCYEMFPLVMVEAFQQKTPVIARKIGSLPEIIQSSGGGLTFATDAEFDSALLRLMHDRALRQELGECGFEAYERDYTPKVHLTRYLDLVESLIEHKKAGVPVIA